MRRLDKNKVLCHTLDHKSELEVVRLLCYFNPYVWPRDRTSNLGIVYPLRGFQGKCHFLHSSSYAPNQLLILPKGFLGPSKSK